MYIKNADNQRNTMLMRLSRAHRFLIVSVLPPVLLNVRNCLIINHLKLFYKDVFLRMRQIPAAINVLSEVKNQVSGNLYYLSNLITLVIQRRISDCSYAAVSFMYGNPSVLGLPFYAKNNNSDTLFKSSLFVKYFDKSRIPMLTGNRIHYIRLLSEDMDEKENNYKSI